MRQILFGVMAACGLLGCAPSEEEVQDEFAAFIASRRGCEQDTDCAVVYPGCPLGCYVAVAEEHVEAVEKKARELVEDYERAGRSCDYDCMEPPEPVCRAGGCEWLSTEDGG